MKLARASGRTDVCALPYGINTVSLFAYVFLVMLPAKLAAEAAGDTYPTRPSLAANGPGTLVAAAFGSCFPTTIYIGHPGWKALGARAGYSTPGGPAFSPDLIPAFLASDTWIHGAFALEQGFIFFTPADTVVSLTPAWPWALGYAVMAAVFFLARWVTVEADGGGH